VLAVINILYGALIALVQKDFKFVIGYSSVSHMGFVLLGLATLNSIGLSGAVLQMFSHGILAGLLFAVAGSLVYERTHTRNLDELDNLSNRMPAITWIFVIGGLASMGLPGFSGFVAEFQIIMGVWQQPNLSYWILVFVGIGVLASFAYTLSVIHKAFFKKSPVVSREQAEEVYPPLTLAESVGSIILICSTLLIGCFPSLLTDLIKSGVDEMLKR
jgi:NADH-quinone oxidoreductase subunit M